MSLNEVLCDVFTNGELSIILQHKTLLDEKDVKSLFIKSASNGHLHIVKWFIKNYRIDWLKPNRIGDNGTIYTNYDEKLDTRTAIVHSLSNSHLDVFLYLINVFNVEKEDFFDEAITIFHYASARGYISVLQYLIEEYDIDFREGIPPFDDFDAFDQAVESGQLEVLKFLTKQFNIDEDYIKDTDITTFVSAAMGGYLDILKWMRKTFNITRIDIVDSSENDAFTEAARNGHLDVLKWLHKICKYTPAEIHANDNSAYNYALEEGHTHVCEWIIEQFGAI